jgi:predicted transcriptional regulator
MPAKKKEPVKTGPTLRDVDEIWNVIEEMQKNLDYINEKLERIMNRMGLE